MRPAQLTYILRVKEVCALLKLSKSSLYAKLQQGNRYHDPSFPKPIKLGAAAVGWTEQSIMTWLEGRATTTH